jgi:hypothetical protein
MTTKTLDLDDIFASLEEILEMLDLDTEIILTKGDTQIARLSPITPTQSDDSPRIPGLHAGTTWVSDDFDAPLPDEFWTGE